MMGSSETERHDVEQSSKQRKSQKVKVRLIPIWLRLMIIGFLLFISIAVGAIIGYSVLGDGHPLGVFKKSTWQQIVNFITEE